MEIKVGDYYRTKKGLIRVIKTINNAETRKEKHLGYTKRNILLINGRHTLEEITKHSPNIIDLVEVGDVIRYKIHNISTTLETKGYIEGIINIPDKEMLQRIKEDKNYEVLEILTHELYEANCYKVGGEDE